MLLPHILHWLPMAIRINKVIRDLPFFFFSCPSNFILYFLALLHAQNMTDDVEICKHTIFFHLSSCLHMLFPPLGMFILPQNFASSCAGGFVRPLWITHRQQLPPTLKLPHMALSSMTVSCTKHPNVATYGTRVHEQLEGSLHGLWSLKRWASHTELEISWVCSKYLLN